MASNHDADLATISIAAAAAITKAGERMRAMRASFITGINEFNIRFANARKALAEETELHALLREAQSIRRYRAQIAYERLLAQQHVKNEAARICRELGLD